jgi:hypothetical protein
MNTPDNLVPRVTNLENLMQYMAETQRQLSANLQILTNIVQEQGEQIKSQQETIMVMQGQIGLLLNKLLGNS